MQKGKTYVKNSPVVLNASSILYEGGGKTLDKLIDIIYPVGSVYISTNSTSPKNLFGGSWTQVKGYYLFASSDVGGTYGGAWSSGSTALNINQIPSHSHSYQSGRWYYAERDGGGEIITNHSGTSYIFGRTTGASGGNQGHTHTVEPPWFKVFVWYRTA